MSKKVYPNPSIYVIDKSSSFQANQSNISVNNSFLHSRYQSPNETNVSNCFLCESSGTSALMSICDCDDRLFHQDCLKEWLRQILKTPDNKVTTDNDDDISLLKCDKCLYDIRFKLQRKCRVKSFSQIGQYCSRHKGLTFFMVLTLMLLLTCAAFILLLHSGTLPITDQGLTKQVFLIALLVVFGLLLIVIGCCCLDCLRTEDKNISTMYNREGKSHRSSRSNRSNRSRSRGKKEEKSHNKLVVESIQ